jgi:hypothetical protein
MLRIDALLPTKGDARVIGRTTLRGVVCGAFLLMMGACSTGPPKEVTSIKPYADIVGSRYQVIADDLYAYGVYKSPNERTIDSVVLVPHGNIAGREFAFRRLIPKGQVLKIRSAWETFVLFDTGVYYLVDIENENIPRNVPVELELFRNSDGGAELNPEIYRKLQ